MTADAGAVSLVCPRCRAPAGERCAGIQLGSHTARVALWQAQQRAQHVAPPDDERARVAAFLRRLRAERHW